jgi:short-chain fatty acids transporter
MMKKAAIFFTRLCEAYLPDAFVFSLILTLLVFIMGLFFTPHTTAQLVGYWGQDFWSLNAFAMQMMFVLLSGHMLATTPLMRKLLLILVSKITNEKQGLVVMAIFSTLACFLNWGFGLIVSGIMAIELARKLKKLNFGLLVATAYAGFMVWHGGISGSIPLKIAGHDEILSKVYPELTISLQDTIFSSWNLIIVFSVVLMIPVLALWMRTDQAVEVPPAPSEIAESINDQTFRSRVEQSPFFNIIFFLGFLWVLVQGFQQGQSLDINRINLIFLSLALLLHQTPYKFLKALQESFPYASGIVIQFPFYAGIMGLMQYSGLADSISEFFVSISTQTTLPALTFLSGGVVNFFVPSGGGQWVVQGPIMLKAAKDLGADPARISMALAWGDAWTNLIQPFWALPIIGMARLQLKDIMGYCLIYTIISGALITTLLVLL